MASATASASSAPGSTASAAAPSATGSASVAAGALTPEEFCSQAVKLGAENLAKCADSEKANVPCLGHVKDLSTADKECSMRVQSKNVEYHPDAGYRCIDAARKRGGKTTFFTFDVVPACAGVLTGKVGENQPALFAEECAPGLAMLKNRCVKPVAKNNPCEDFPAGLLGKLDDHPRCQEGLACFTTKDSADGLPAELTCLPPSEAGAPCKLDINTCAEGSSCYQGHCRQQATEGGQCMARLDCGPELSCEIKGGVFGSCVAKPQALEICGSPSH